MRYLNEVIEKRRSRIHRWGVFATEPIPKNTRIIDYAGEKISNQESLRREARYIERGHIWCFKLTNRTVIDAAVGGNLARFINHSCRPNCYVHIQNGTIWIRAARSPSMETAEQHVASARALCPADDRFIGRLTALER